MHIHTVFGLFNNTNEIMVLTGGNLLFKKISFHFPFFVYFHFKQQPVQSQISPVDPKCSL